jgi:hypothetical protein
LSDEERQQALLAEILWRDLLEQDERDACAADPKMLLRRMVASDEREAEGFHFLSDEGWAWQGDVFDWFHGERRCIALKARQLGVTWLACAYALWTALYRPGSLCLVYRQKEEEAHENVGRAWMLLHSLPRHLWNGAVIEKPSRVHQPIPTEELRLRFPNGAASRIVAMTSASASGHGKTAAVIVLDEFSRIERAEEIMAAVQPAAGKSGKILIVSTANGVSDPETGAGNHFHWLWSNPDSGFSKKFLAWSLHPDRDQVWYDTSEEIAGLPSHRRAEQYPADEFEAFTLTNRVFFDPDDLKHYGTLVPKPLYQFDFKAKDARHAAKDKSARGMIRVFKEPEPDRKYAIGADVATGRGRDYSAAYVVDLGSMEIMAEFHGRLDADQYAFQLHYLGRWFNTALIAVEMAGGYGDAVNVALRDGRAGRPAYPNIYYHVMSNRPDLPRARTFGFPMSTKTRPLVLNQFEQAVRERVLPFVTAQLLREMQTFAHHDKGTPEIRAQDGSRDDCVMACAITLEMYRLRGEHPDRQRKQPKSRFKHWLPINQAA